MHNIEKRFGFIKSAVFNSERHQLSANMSIGAERAVNSCRSESVSKL